MCYDMLVDILEVADGGSNKKSPGKGTSGGSSSTAKK
jgi:hypothetical protein